MNNEMQSLRPVNERLLDRLVDNELDAAGSRGLLKALDESPDGWRRCALAFLEAQAWRSDLRGAVAASALAPSPPAHPVPRTRSRAVRVGQAGLIAAAVILSFGAGWLARPGRDDRLPVDAGTASSGVVQREGDDEERPDRLPADSGKSGLDGQQNVRLAGTLTLEVEDHGQSRTLRVPAPRTAAGHPGLGRPCPRAPRTPGRGPSSACDFQPEGRAEADTPGR